MSMIGNQPGVSSQRTVLEEVVTGSPKSAFVPQAGYIKGYVDVLVNGIEIDATDFTAADGITVTLGTAAAVGDTVKIKAWLPRGLSDGYLKSEADARFHPLISGNLLLTPNAGSNRVIGFASGTDTTLVLQGGGTSGSGANLELTRDYRAFLDATTTEIRSLDGSTVFATLNSNGLSASRVRGTTAVHHGTYGYWKTRDNSAGAEFALEYAISDTMADDNIKLSLSNAGDLYPRGNLKLGSGKGIDFSASSNLGGAAGEILDDYEFGSWTPTIDGGSGLGGLIAGNHYYTKIGKLVHVNGAFTYTSASVGTAYIVVRAPFNHNASGSVNICGVCNAYPSDNNRQSGIVIDNSSGDAYGTYLGFYVSSTGGGTVSWSLTYQAA